MSYGAPVWARFHVSIIATGKGPCFILSRSAWGATWELTFFFFLSNPALKSPPSGVNVALGSQPKAESKSHYFKIMYKENKSWCVADYVIIFFKDCVTELSILDNMGGPGNVRHQIIHLHSVLTSPRDLLFLFTLFCPHQGKWVLALSALCPARPGGALRQLCLSKTMLQVEQDHGTPTSVVPFCVFLKRRKHKTLLTICQFQKTGSWETGQWDLQPLFPSLKWGQLCPLKTARAGMGEKARLQVCS